MKDLKDAMVHDKCEKIGNSFIQHGKVNDRIYLIKYGKDNPASLLSDLEDLALKENYTKIFTKIPASDAPVFISGGYKVEAFVPRFFGLEEDVFFLSKFFDPLREKPPINRLLKLSEVLDKDFGYTEPDNNPIFTIKQLSFEDAVPISNLYRTVFKSYPFPIHDANYISGTMRENFLYFGVFFENSLIAASSSEIYSDSLNAEMTDFAVLPEMRGNNLALLLLSVMEKDMFSKGIRTVYTIARLNSIPMNITFLKRGYKYGGTLINNTNISGNIESMNVLYKYLSKNQFN